VLAGGGDALVTGSVLVKPRASVARMSHARRDDDKGDDKG
jgi:hypothetical protein